MAKKVIRKATVYREVSNIINNGGLYGEYFYLVEPEKGKRQVIEVRKNRTAAFVDSQAVVNALIHYSANEDMGFAYDFTAREAAECVKYWMGVTKPRPMPVYLGEKNEEGLAFQRLSFDYRDEPGETLIIDDFMSRCSNAQAVMAWIGSLMVEDSPRFQYCYIYGSGGEGKGSFARGLVDIFGSGCMTMPVPKTDGQKQFMGYSLLGKRLCIFPECSNFNFPQDPLFKQYTGGDHIWIEQKGKQGFSSPISAKFLFLSNDRPGVGGNDANLRRMIYSEIGKPTVKYSPGIYDALIRAEMPSFIIKCRNMYIDMYPTNESIEIDDQKTRELIEINEERWEVLTSKWFTPSATNGVAPAKLQEIRGLEKLNTFEYRQWIEYMRAYLGVESVVTRVSGNTRRYWRGIRIKSDVTRSICEVEPDDIVFSMGDVT